MINGFYVKKVGNYAIIKGAHTQSALSQNIYGTRYSISNALKNFEVCKYVNVSAGLKAVFRSKLNVGTAVAAVVLDTASDFSRLADEGASAAEIAATLVGDIIFGAAGATASIAAGADIGAALGSIVPVIGTILGAVAGVAIGYLFQYLTENPSLNVKEMVICELTKLLENFF